MARRGRPPLTPEQRKARGSLVRRMRRPPVDPSKPLHVTLRAKKDVPGFRSKRRFLRMRESIRRASDRFGMRVVHFTVMDNHVHLIVEASDRRALTRGMQGLAIRLAKSANGKWRDGKVFRDRYHAVVLESARQVRNAVAYVLLNARRHERSTHAAEGIDPCSTGHWFTGWSRDVGALKAAGSIHIDCSGEPPVAAPRTWLLGIGWRRKGLIDPSEIPGTFAA